MVWGRFPEGFRGFQSWIHLSPDRTLSNVLSVCLVCRRVFVLENELPNKSLPLDGNCKGSRVVLCLSPAAFARSFLGCVGRRGGEGQTLGVWEGWGIWICDFSLFPVSVDFCGETRVDHSKSGTGSSQKPQAIQRHSGNCCTRTADTPTGAHPFFY